MLALIVALLFATPRVGQIQTDVRMGSGVWLAGDGFIGSTVLYDNTVTVTPDNLESEVRAALAGPTIDWTKQGQNAPTVVYNDQVAIAYPNVEQIGAYCVPFCVRGKDGFSKTYVINQPKIFGIAGQDPSKINSGSLCVLLGRHLHSTRAKSSVWLYGADGVLQQVSTLDPGGRGTGNTVDIKRSVIWFKIPQTLIPGDYQLFIFHGESRWGISNLIPITIVPQTPQNVVSVQVGSGTDVTSILSSAKSGKILQLPSGVFLVSKPIDITDGVCIISAGSSTILKGSPDLIGDPNKLVGSRDSMIRLTGSNITFRDLTIELTPGTTRSAIAANAGVDSVTFENCRFVSNTPEVNKDGYCDGFFYRWGLWRYWTFRNCEFRCQQAFEGTNGPLNGFRTNGAMDFCLYHMCSFQAPYGIASGSLFGSAIGRGSLAQDVHFESSRRGFALSAGDGTLESAIIGCNFSDMLSELGNGETILHEARGSFVGQPQPFLNQYLPTCVYFPGDTQDRTRWTAAIISGTGFGQYRVIKQSISGIHILEQPWEIPPDSTSMVLISQCPTDCAFVFNRFSNCVGGINLYGNSFGCLFYSNWMRDSHEGLMLNTDWNTTAGSRSVAWWHSARSNIFEDGAGFNFVASRATADLSMLHPQIAFLSTHQNQTFGTVTNQLRAMEGLDTEQGTITQTQSLKFPLIDYVSSAYESGYSGKTKYHGPVIDQRPQQPFWYRTASGIGNVRIGGSKWDDVPVSADKVIQVAP